MKQISKRRKLSISEDRIFYKPTDSVPASQLHTKEVERKRELLEIITDFLRKNDAEEIPLYAQTDIVLSILPHIVLLLHMEKQ